MNKLRRYIRSRIDMFRALTADEIFHFVDIVFMLVLGLIAAVLFVILANWATRFFA